MDELKQKDIFDAWLKKHKGIFFKIVRAYAFNSPDQEDLFQEICLQVWKSIPEYRGEAKVSTWIYRVALYTAVAYVRDEKKQPRTQPIGEMEHSLMMNEPVDDRLNWLYEQISQLDPIDRSISLLLLDGYSYKEMANLTGISESNVGVRIYRIKQHLLRKSKELENYGV